MTATGNVPLQLVLGQRSGENLEVLVSAGERVSRGQLLARPLQDTAGSLALSYSAPQPAALCSPCSGVILGVSLCDVVGSGVVSRRSCLLLDADQACSHRRVVQIIDADLNASAAYQSNDAEALAASVDAALLKLERPSQREAGIRDIGEKSGLTGLGGGGFALHAKLKGSITRLVINAGECEPYADADRAIMDSAPAEIVAGCLLAAALLGLSTYTLALKVTLADTRTRLLTAESILRRNCSSALATLQPVEVPASYPSGAEQQIVKQAYDIEIPAGMRASEFGVACINVSTAHALARFILFKEPLTHRIVTVAGSTVAKPGNYRVPNGLPVADLLSAAGLRQQELAALVHGGGMMGVRLAGADLPLTRSSYCIVAAGQHDKGLAIEKAIQEAAGKSIETLPCIRCGDCEPVCPVGLLPQQLYTAARTDNADWLQAEHLAACIECGACEAVCPSMIPLVPSFRSAKTREAERQLQRDKAIHARNRFEQRAQRLQEEREQQDSKRAARRTAGRRPASRNRTSGPE